MTDGMVTELCCGQLCNPIERDKQVKLLGVQEFIRLYRNTVVMNAEQVHLLEEMATKYKLTLMPLE